MHSNNNFHLINDEVSQAEHYPVCYGQNDIQCLLELAKVSHNKRHRFLLHPTKHDKFHEMLISIPGNSFDIPHMNIRSGKSFTALAGCFSVVIFDEDCNYFNHNILEANGNQFPSYLRLQEPVWHTIMPCDGQVVFKESIAGPFLGNIFSEQFTYPDSKDFKGRVLNIRKNLDNILNS